MPFPQSSPLLKARGLHWVTSSGVTCTIISPVLVSDGQGGLTETGTTVKAANVPCWYGPFMVRRPTDEVLTAGRLGSLLPWLFLLPAGTAIARTDRIVVSGRTFEVNDIGSAAPWESTLRVVTRELV